MRELLLGCGSQPRKLLHVTGDSEWHDVTTLDMNAALNPDVVWDLNHLPLPFETDSFDEIAAYDVLEHCGKQGDWRFFLAQFEDFWRILKPGGYFMGICPKPTSSWAWADPGHTRMIAPDTLVYLVQPLYGSPPMTDYRPWYKADFDIVHMGDFSEYQHAFVLQAVKPARIAPAP